MFNRSREERIAALIDELMDHPEEDFLSGKMMRAWAEKCLEFETEERDANIAFLKHINAAPTAVNMVARGVHRQRSTIVMKAVKAAGPELLKERKEAVDKLLGEYIQEASDTEAHAADKSGIRRRFVSCDAAGGDRRR